MINNKKALKIAKFKELGKPIGHIPATNESKLLRRLMSENGITKEQVYSIAKYRKMLSEEQQKRGQGGLRRIIKQIRQGITKKMKLPKEHPLVIKAVNERIIEYRNYWYIPCSIRYYTYRGEI